MLRDIQMLMDTTSKSLVLDFHKTEEEAKELVECSKMQRYLENNPVGLNKSGYDWAIIILVENRDIETLEKYLK